MTNYTYKINKANIFAKDFKSLCAALNYIGKTDFIVRSCGYSFNSYTFYSKTFGKKIIIERKGLFEHMEKFFGLGLNTEACKDLGSNAKYRYSLVFDGDELDEYYDDFEDQNYGQGELDPSDIDLDYVITLTQDQIKVYAAYFDICLASEEQEESYLEILTAAKNGESLDEYYRRG